MPGLRGQNRTPGMPARTRRNFDQLSGEAEFAVGGIITLDDEGRFTIATGDGVTIVSDQLVAALVTDGGLEFSGGEIQLDLHDTAPGLEIIASNGLRVKLVATGGIELVAGGLQLKAPTGSDRGGVLQATAEADLNQTITDPPTQTEVQDISDKIDALLAKARTSQWLAT